MSGRNVACRCTALPDDRAVVTMDRLDDDLGVVDSTGAARLTRNAREEHRVAARQKLRTVQTLILTARDDDLDGTSVRGHTDDTRGVREQDRIGQRPGKPVRKVRATLLLVEQHGRAACGWQALDHECPTPVLHMDDPVAVRRERGGSGPETEARKRRLRTRNRSYLGFVEVAQIETAVRDIRDLRAVRRQTDHRHRCRGQGLFRGQEHREPRNGAGCGRRRGSKKPTCSHRDADDHGNADEAQTYRTSRPRFALRCRPLWVLEYGLKLDARIRDRVQSVARLLRQATLEQVLEPRVQAGRQAAPVGLGLEHVSEHVRNGFTLEKREPGQHLAEHNTKGPHVRALIRGLPACLLG